jgi:hypothetical protein
LHLQCIAPAKAVPPSAPEGIAATNATAKAVPPNAPAKAAAVRPTTAPPQIPSLENNLPMLGSRFHPSCFVDGVDNSFLSIPTSMFNYAEVGDSMYVFLCVPIVHTM